MNINNLDDVVGVESFYSNKIVYEPLSALNAMRCLLNMQNLEGKPNFGKLKYKSSFVNIKNRYIIENYKDKIDSTFYTDTATSILGYTIQKFDEMFYGFQDIFDDYYSYIDDEHDLINDSEGEYGDFKGDDSIFEDIEGMSEAFRLYAYYSDFEIITDDEKEKLLTDDLLWMTSKNNKISGNFDFIFKKKENINGSVVNFYYVSDQLWQIDTKLLQHDYNLNFLSDRIPGNVLEWSKFKHGDDCLNITTLCMSCLGYGRERIEWAGLALTNSANIYLNDNYFTDAICHEIGHLVDNSSMISQDVMSPIFFENGGKTWDILADEYADDIATIRIGADISCGYAADQMKEMIQEFYAESFQLYFYSEETRSALPKDIRGKIEGEIENYTSQLGR